MTLPSRDQPAASPCPPERTSDAPLTLATNFVVRVDGAPIACARVETLSLAADDERLVRKEHPGPPPQVRWSAPPATGRLVLARALDGDRTLYQWRRDAIDGKDAVRTIVVEHLDRPCGKVLYRFEITHCWPLRWTGPRYDAFTGGIAFEELEVVHADLHWR
jgi:phage tail-like protein